MHRLPLAAALVPIALAGGCLQGPAPPRATPTPKASKTPAPTPTPVPTPETCTPVPTLAPPAGTLVAKTVLAWVAVEFRAAGDVVATLRNLTAQAVDVTGWQLCGGEFVYGAPSRSKTSIPASADVRIHVNPPAGCAETDLEWCAEAAAGVSALSGNLAIYRAPVSFTSTASLVDFVEWGKGGLPREDVADKAGIWQAGVFVPVNGCQASLSVKVPGGSGAEMWQ